VRRRIRGRAIGDVMDGVYSNDEFLEDDQIMTL